MACVAFQEPSETPTWLDNYLCSPTNLGLVWSYAGVPNGLDCTSMNVPNDPDAWSDNYLCVVRQSSIPHISIEWRIDYTPPDSGASHCVQITEPDENDPASWVSNWICTDQDYGFQWSSGGPIAGMVCTQFYEPSDGSWSDNWLCSPANYGMVWSNAGAIAGMNCISMDVPTDPDSWTDNYLCLPP
jgi:hypothetical protein